MREHIAVVARRNLAVAEFYASALPDDHPRKASSDSALERQRANLPALPGKRHTRIKPQTACDIDAVYNKPTTPLEREVLKAVTKALRADPRVARVERNQSGTFREGERWIKVGTRGKLDLTVYLKSGRYMEIEVKRPGGKPDPRQALRIEAIKREGGLAGWCWSAESALALLP